MHQQLDSNFRTADTYQPSLFLKNLIFGHLRNKHLTAGPLQQLHFVRPADTPD
jgi:hypothetical protein